MEDRENLTFSHKGKTYRVMDLSKEGQIAFFQIRELQNKIQGQQFRLQQLDMAHVGFMKILEPAAEALEAASVAQTDEAGTPVDVTEDVIASAKAETPAEQESAPVEETTAPEGESLPPV